MTAYQALKTLLLPPGIIILMLVGATLGVPGGAGRALLCTATAGLTLLSLPVVSILLMVPLEPYPPLDLRAPLEPPIKGILVLGGGFRRDAPEYGGPTLDNFTLQRVRYGAWLQRSTGLPLYVSGGFTTARRPAVGDLMARILREEFAVPVAGVENVSRTTWENAAYSRAMLARDGVSQVLLVSDAWHLPRAVAACERVGLAVIPAPTGLIAGPHWRDDLAWSDWVPRAGALTISAYALHEHLGRAWYQLRRWASGTSAPPFEPPGTPIKGPGGGDAT
ncbi:YdcF family protein [uncultured Thiodictyon sp.]|uniref:YdcF family protein n=1 Tax=uncultured Thiodictyon sp. TaxID=1846217 RepID=UPI0025F8A4AA|nr:YdcF family protein [uncultured Thiodictyon sp.]